MQRALGIGPAALVGHSAENLASGAHLLSKKEVVVVCRRLRDSPAF